MQCDLSADRHLLDDLNEAPRDLFLRRVGAVTSQRTRFSRRHHYLCVSFTAEGLLQVKILSLDKFIVHRKIQGKIQEKKSAWVNLSLQRDLFQTNPEDTMSSVPTAKKIFFHYFFFIFASGFPWSRRIRE